MNAFEVVRSKLEQGMVKGGMHGCLRDVGRLAGGYAAAGAIDGMQLFDLGIIARDLSQNQDEGAKKWRDAVNFGKREPIEFTDGYVSGVDDAPAYEWDSTIGGGSNLKVIDSHYVSDQSIPEPKDWDPVNDLITYLETVFEANDIVAYVTESYYNEKAEKHLPKKGNFDRTAGQLIEELQKCNGDMGRVMGDTKDEVGAWIRFNPVDGLGICNDNVTNYRYSLIESDELSVERQYALMKELELPIAAMVHSGGKSIHAIVRVDADSMTEYKKRVDFLWEVCQRNGLKLDTQNRNPSRLSRMPGVTRNGNKQFLVHTNIGKATWSEWKEWIEDINDDLPDIEPLEIDGTEPELAPEIIVGLLREGHKMLIAGPSKAGKSFALMQLAIAVAEGKKWFDWQVKRGHVLYVNLELDKRSCKHRFWKIYKTMNLKNTKGSIDVWDLRGNSASLDKLTPKLIRRAQKNNYTMIIIDPIYKVLTGDENSAEQMAIFCNQFDRICKELNTAVVYCHHHSKGAQGHKTSQDRSSGSGVFARDPDAIMDMMELTVDEAIRDQITNRWACDAMAKAFDAQVDGWRDSCGDDDAQVLANFRTWADKNNHQKIYQAILPEVMNASALATGWRIEGTLREFAGFPPRNFFYRYPVHVPDERDLLKLSMPVGEAPPWQKKKGQKVIAKESRSEDRCNKVNFAWQTLNAGNDDDAPPSFDDLVDQVNKGLEGDGRSKSAIRKWIKEDCTDMYHIVGAKVLRIEDNGE